MRSLTSLKTLKEIKKRLQRESEVTMVVIDSYGEPRIRRVRTSYNGLVSCSFCSIWIGSRPSCFAPETVSVEDFIKLMKDYDTQQRLKIIYVRRS